MLRKLMALGLAWTILHCMQSASIAGYTVYTGDAGGFVANSATSAYLAAQGTPTEFISFSTDKNGNAIGGGTSQVSGDAFSNRVTFSSSVSATHGGTDSTFVDQGNGNSVSSEIGPSAGFAGILNINFLTNGLAASSVGFGTVILNDPLATITAYDQNNVLIATYNASTFASFEFFGLVGSGGSEIGRLQLDGTFYAIQDIQFVTTPVSVPEPSSIFMLATGCLSAGTLVIRTRRRTA